jgi:hypothetical protein
MNGEREKMSIPTRDELQELIDHIKESRPKFAYPPEKWRTHKPIEAEVRRVLTIMADAIHEALEAKSKLPAAVWLTSQPIIRKAADSAFKTKSKKNHPAEKSNNAAIFWIDKDTEHLMKLSETLADAEAFYAKAQAFFDHDWHSSRWFDHIASILLEYFHTDHATQSIELQRNINARINRAMAALDDLIELEKELITLNSPDPSRVTLRRPNEINLGLRRTRSWVGRWNPYPEWLNLPFTRNDPHIREQVLVYRFWQSHQRNKWFPASCVADLMYLEGIEHPYDVRTIERLYKKFTDIKNQKIDEMRRDKVQQ